MVAITANRPINLTVNNLPSKTLAMLHVHRFQKVSATLFCGRLSQFLAIKIFSIMNNKHNKILNNNTKAIVIDNNKCNVK